MTRIQIPVIIVLAAWLGGCATTWQARDLQPSGFLAEYHAQLQSGAEDGPLRKYSPPGADWSPYRKIMLDPVVIWEGFSTTISTKEREDLQRLADAFYNKLYLKLSKDYELVEKPEPGTMHIQVAITHAEKAWTATAFLSRVIWQLLAVNVLWTAAKGKPAFVGEITMEFKVHDAQTGELLVAGADRRVGSLNPIHKEVFSSWGDVKNSLEFWSDMSAYRLCVLRSGTTACARPKA